MENLEIEYKVMINKDGFNKVLNHFKDVPIIDQTNNYYETPNNAVTEEDLSLRIRYIKNDNSYLLTLKETLSVGKLEHEFYVKGNDISYLPAEIIDILNKYNINYKDLKCIGSLRTIRREIKTEEYNLCLDENHYNNIVDYEIECEANDMKKAKKTIIDLLEPLNIEYQKSKKSKLGRFKASLN